MSKNLVIKECEINNKIIELTKTKDLFDKSKHLWIASRFDNDRDGYTFMEHYENEIQAIEKYDELINIELEKMSHQF